MRIGIGSDHAGCELKSSIILHLSQAGFEVVNFGTDNGQPADYPVIAEAVGTAVTDSEVDFGILICGTGIGMSIAANKVRGIRAALCSEPYSARLTKQHNNSNILVLGARVIGVELAKCIVDEWLGAEFEGGRHQTRIDLISKMEK